MGTLIYLAAFIVACAGSFQLRRRCPYGLAKRCGVLDQPNARKVHLTPIPRWGGFGIYLGVLLGVFGVYVGLPGISASSWRSGSPSTATAVC